jgi:hypothetical protein
MERAPSDADRLREVKDDFRSHMLGSDVFFALLQRRAPAEDGVQCLNRELPDFGCEPTFEDQLDGTAKLGVRLAYGLNAVEHVELGVMNSDHEFDHDPDFQLEVAGVTDYELGSPDAIRSCAQVMNAWREGWNHMARTMGQAAVIDPLQHTVILREEFERTVYPE